MSIDITKPYFLDLNFFDQATLTGGAQATMPLTNMQTQNPRQVWGSPDLIDPSFTLVFADNNEFNGIAIAGHNLTVNGTLSIYGHSVNDFSDLNAVDFSLLNIEAYPVLFGAGEGGAGLDCGAGGTPLTRQLPLYNNTFWSSFPLNEFLFWKFIFSDPTNPDGFIQVGRVLFGYGWQPVYGIDFGRGLQDEDPSQQTRTAGGGMNIDVEPQFRRLDFSFKNLEDQERYFRLYTQKKLSGRHQGMFVSLDPDPNSAGSFFESGYFIIEKSSSIKMSRHDFNSVQISMVELI